MKPTSSLRLASAFSFVFVAGFSPLGAEDLPLAARRAVESYEAKVDRLAETYKKGVEKEQEGILKFLSGELAKAEKRGREGDAAAIRERIRKIRRGDGTDVRVAEGMLSAEELIDEDWLMERSVESGKWSPLKFKKEGRAVWDSKNDANYRLTPDRVVIRFSNGVTYQISRFPNEKGRYTGTRSSGGTLVMRKK